MRAAIVLVALALAACGADEERAVDQERAAAPAGEPIGLPIVEHPPGCDAPRVVRGEAAMWNVTPAFRVFRRTQHAPDALTDDELRGLPVGGYDPSLTRAVGDLLLVPSYDVRESCESRRPSAGGVCVVRRGVEGSRCFEMDEIGAGRAVVALEDGVAGVVRDEIEAVDVGDEVVAVSDNVWRARSATSVRLIERSLEGCEPSPAVRAAAPTLDNPPDPGGVPEAVRRSMRFDVDSRVAARYGRIWGGGDGITYWITPRLKCELAYLEADEVCITPLKPEYSHAASGCVEPGKTGWIHFPDGEVSAIAGFAPDGTTEAVVRIRDKTMILPVHENVFAGRLTEIPLHGEVGPPGHKAEVTFR